MVTTVFFPATQFCRVKAKMYIWATKDNLFSHLNSKKNIASMKRFHVDTVPLWVLPQLLNWWLVLIWSPCFRKQLKKMTTVQPSVNRRRWPFGRSPSHIRDGQLLGTWALSPRCSKIRNNRREKGNNTTSTNTNSHPEKTDEKPAYRLIFHLMWIFL